ncbi:MAG TPA: hypothetical protein VLK89_03570 [Solirubrobacterales bacterium]|nr:hypothetical protein [Solirubrobacterales bacterium]
MSVSEAFLPHSPPDSIADADFEAVLALHSAGAIGTFDAAVIEKTDDGKVHVHKTEKPTQHGAWKRLELATSR